MTNVLAKDWYYLLKDEFKLPFLRYVDGYKYKEISEELNSRRTK